MANYRRHTGLQRRLLDRSVEAYILSLETINRISINYRIEAFTYLICNAWELMLKAKIISDAHSSTAIYYKAKRGQLARTYSLRDCLKVVLPDPNDPVRRNLEFVEELRDEGTHLVMRQVPREVVGLFQACVVNYHAKLAAWFGLSLSKRVQPGMMTLVYDFSPEHFDLSNARLRRQLGAVAARYLSQFQARLRQDIIALNQAPEFYIGVNYRLVLTQKPGDGDIMLTKGETGTMLGVVETYKDPSTTHPYRCKEVVNEVNAIVGEHRLVTAHDIQAVVAAYKITRRAEYFYCGKVKGSPRQYSRAFVEWCVKEYRQDSGFFRKACERYRDMQWETRNVRSSNQSA